MKTNQLILLILAVSLFLMNCIHAQEKDKNSKVYPKWYYYEPTESILSGIVNRKTFWGPPGYGEHPKTDRKEVCYILTLDKPINVIADSLDEWNNKTVKNVKKVQLILDLDEPEHVGNMVGQHVHLRGCLTHSATAHDHTEILLHVQKKDFNDKKYPAIIKL